MRTGFLKKKLSGGWLPKTESNGNITDRPCLTSLMKFPRPLLAMLSLCTFLSVLSLLGCHFLKVNIGFVPANVQTNSDTLDVGIFSICDPSNGSCAHMADPYYSLGFNKVFGRYYQMFDKIKVGGDGSSQFQVPGDAKWTGVRAISIIAALIYFLGALMAFLTEFTTVQFTVETICNVTFIASLCECVKCGCFFFVEMCVANVWIDNTHIRTQGSYLKAAESCKFNKDSIVSIFVICFSTCSLCLVNMNKIKKEKDPATDGESRTILQYESDEDDANPLRSHEELGFSLIAQSLSLTSLASSKSKDSEKENNKLLDKTLALIEDDEDHSQGSTNDDIEEQGTEENQTQIKKQPSASRKKDEKVLRARAEADKNEYSTSDDESIDSTSSYEDDNSHEQCTSVDSTQVTQNKKKGFHHKYDENKTRNFSPKRIKESRGHKTSPNRKHQMKDVELGSPDNLADSSDFHRTPDNHGYRRIDDDFIEESETEYDPRNRRVDDGYSRDEDFIENKIEKSHNEDSESEHSPFRKVAQRQHPSKIDYSSDSS